MIASVPHSLSIQTLSDGYPQLIAILRDHGNDFAKGEERIRELHPFMLQIRDPRDRILDVPGRLCNPGFMAAEAVWILGGSDQPWIFEYNSKLRAYTNDGVIVGAYGPRLRRWRGHQDQIACVVERLRSWMGTQRATMAIFDPAIDNRWHNSVPCTLAFRFMARQGVLDMTAVMRAQDVWLGLPYDLFTFTLLHELVAGFTGLQVGPYYHFMDVFRFYAVDWSEAERVERTTAPRARVTSAAMDWDIFQEALPQIVTFAEDPLRRAFPSGLGEWWTDLLWTLFSYRAHRARRYGAAIDAQQRITNQFGSLLRRWFRRYMPARALPIEWRDELG